MLGSTPKPPAPRPANDDDALFEFSSEAAPVAVATAPAAPAAPPKPGGRLGVIVITAVVVTAAATYGLTRLKLPSFGGGAASGKLTVTTRPEGADVLVDGQPRGVTPLTLALPPGEHSLAIRSGGVERLLPLTVAAGADIVRDLEMPALSPVSVTGVLSVVTDPPGARVSVDGRQVGVSPATVERLSAAEHTVVVASDTGSAERTVTIGAGRTTSVVFSLPKASGPLAGWLTVSAPFDVQVLEKDEVIGAGGSQRIMLAAGRHDLVIANKAIDFQDTRRVEVAAGKTIALRIDPPKVSVSVNARPWADVLIDGTTVGQTPIANVVVALGSHTVVFRHPQLGERRQTVVVTAKGPNRIAVDLTK
jgi:PEGA domain